MTIGVAGVCALVLTLAAMAASAAQAVPVSVGCEVNINPSSSTWSISGYNPFSSSPLSATYNVTFSNSGTAECDFSVLFQTNSEPYGLAGSGGQSLPYSLLDTSDNANATPFGGLTPAPSQPHFQLQPGGQQIVSYSFIVDLSQLPTDGDFDQQLLVTAESGVTVLAQKQIELTLNVTPSAVISLRGAYTASTHGGAYIDLGDLQPGPATTLLQLYVQSTGGYRLEADSLNNGQLKLNGGGAWAINYSMNIRRACPRPQLSRTLRCAPTGDRQAGSIARGVRGRRYVAEARGRL